MLYKRGVQRHRPAWYRKKLQLVCFLFLINYLYVKKLKYNRKEIIGFLQHCCRNSVLPLHTSSLKPKRSLWKGVKNIFRKRAGAAVKTAAFVS